jgi:hypothetical protein
MRTRCLRGTFSLRTLLLLVAVSGPALGYGGPRLLAAWRACFASPQSDYPADWMIY